MVITDIHRSTRINLPAIPKIINRNWEFAVWGKNLTDEEFIVDMRNTTRSQFGTPVAAINQPRSYGIEVAYTY